MAKRCLVAFLCILLSGLLIARSIEYQGIKSKKRPIVTQRGPNYEWDCRNRGGAGCTFSVQVDVADADGM
jgi:hypothetical protein